MNISSLPPPYAGQFLPHAEYRTSQKSSGIQHTLSHQARRGAIQPGNFDLLTFVKKYRWQSLLGGLAGWMALSEIFTPKPKPFAFPKSGYFLIIPVLGGLAALFIRKGGKETENITQKTIAQKTGTKGTDPHEVQSEVCFEVEHTDETITRNNKDNSNLSPDNKMTTPNKLRKKRKPEKVRKSGLLSWIQSKRSKDKPPVCTIKLSALHLHQMRQVKLDPGAKETLEQRFEHLNLKPGAYYLNAGGKFVLKPPGSIETTVLYIPERQDGESLKVELL